MSDRTTSEARERVLNTAEKLFMERGYKSVTLKDIAEALKMRQASLYYHVPGGKEALFIEVTERAFARYHQGLKTAIAQAAPDIVSQLRAAAHWLIAQPVVDLGRMSSADLHELPPNEYHRLGVVAMQSLMMPVAAVFEAAYHSGESRVPEALMLAGSFLTIIAGIHNLSDEVLAGAQANKRAVADAMIDVLLNGIRPR